jgi:hypothetical protein
LAGVRKTARYDNHIARDQFRASQPAQCAAVVVGARHRARDFAEGRRLKKSRGNPGAFDAPSAQPQACSTAFT